MLHFTLQVPTLHVSLLLAGSANLSHSSVGIWSTTPITIEIIPRMRSMKTMLVYHVAVRGR